MQPGYCDLAERMEISDQAASLLDLGGGDGRLAIVIAQRHPHLLRLVSGDISRDMTKRARRRIAKAGLSSRISAECLDMHRLPYCDEAFDAVVSFGALHHSRQPSVMLHEGYRVLRPGGQLCMIDGYGRPSFATILQAVRAFGGSLAAAVAYWCGSKDCLSREEIAGLVPEGSRPDIKVSFTGVLAVVRGTKGQTFEPVAPP